MNIAKFLRTAFSIGHRWWLLLENTRVITTEDAVIHDETDVTVTTRDTATNTISNGQEVDDISALIGRKLNDLSDKTKKGCKILKTR